MSYTATGAPDKLIEKKPIPSIEWMITNKCNYKCLYCCQKNPTLKNKQHCSEKTIHAMSKLLNDLEGQWLIKLVGGEPLFHPNYIDICKMFLYKGHKICLTTNFSIYNKLQELVELAGDKLDFVTASLHLDQVKSIDVFLEKANAFNTIKHQQTKFTITSVFLEDKLELLQNVSQRLEKLGIKFELSHKKKNGSYINYKNKESKKFLNKFLLENVKEIKGKNFFGTLCYTGKSFFFIQVNGDVTRCFNLQPNFYMGNIERGTFKRFSQVTPCLSNKCTNTVPVNRSMIQFDKKAGKLLIAKSIYSNSLKNFVFIGDKLIRKWKDSLFS